MQEINLKVFHAPLIGKVTDLCRYIYKVHTLPKKDIRIHFVLPLLSSCRVLFMQAMREIKGKNDYYKRAMETIEEIQSQSYLIHSMGGWNMKVTAAIDCMCDEIAEQLYKVAHAQTSITKSKDKSE